MYWGKLLRIFLYIHILRTKTLAEMKAITSPVTHAEGPHWDHKESALYFVDTFAPTVLKWSRRDDITTSHQLEGNSVGVVIPMKNRSNTFLLAHDRHLSTFTWDGQEDNTGTIEPITMVDHHKPNNQFNDGKVDCCGRAWIGTLTRNDDLSVAPKGGSLYLMDANKRPKIMIKTTSISNGLAWNKESTNMFFCDSEDRKIYAFEFIEKTGDIINRKILFDVADHEELHGIPDGMTIDNNDNLWVALYGGGAVIQVDSETGELLHTLTLPVTYVTSCTFGGINFATLYITTSRLKLDEEQLKEESEAGCVFAVEDLKGVYGFPANEFKLSAQCQCTDR